MWLIDGHGVITNPEPWPIQRIDATPTGELYAFLVEMPGGWPLVQCEKAPAVPDQAAALSVDDEELVARIKSASNVAKVAALVRGDWMQEYPSQSEADLALCCHLAFWTRAATQIDRLFRTSGLMRDKWDAKRGSQTYGERTIAEALARQIEYYSPPPTLVVSRNGSTPGYVWGTPELQDFHS